MQRVSLGQTGLFVSPIALGTMQFCWTTTAKEAEQILDCYTEFGGNLIDTADMYTQWAQGCTGGEAERIIGNWIKKRKNRENIILSSKVRSRMWEGKDGEGLSYTHIVKACEDSLRRLQTDYLDLYFSHWPDEGTPEEETLAAYQTLIQSGKVRFIGCSNYSAQQLEHALALNQQGLPTYTVIQALYNLIDRKHFEAELLPVVTKYHLSVLAYSPLASGFLSGVYQTNKPLPDNARAEFVKEKMTPENMRLLGVVEELAQNYNATVSQIALAWLLQQKTITGLITGADTPPQLKENLGALSLTLAAGDLTQLQEISKPF